MYKRRTFLKTASAGFLWPALRAASQGKEKKRPNILFLFSDQHRADVLGCEGNRIVQTPALDGLAARGTRFSRAYCQDAVCVASRTSLMCGLYSRTTGALQNDEGALLPHDGKMVPLQKLLQANGYFTGCFGKRHLPVPMSDGWNHSATTISPAQDPSDENYYDWIKARGQWAEHELDWKHGEEGAFAADLMCRISDVKDENRTPAYVVEKTVEFLKKSKENGSPFFCWSSFIFPHQPYVPSPKWAALYPPEKMPLPANWNEPVENLPPGLQNWRLNEKPPWNCGTAAKHPELYQRYIAYYYALMSEVDYSIGLILKELEALGMADDTIIVYSSDHGEFTAAHGMVEKCARFHNVYEDTLRVPLIISCPAKFRQGQVCEGLVELTDFYPTILDAADIRMPAGTLPLAGKSLVPTLAGGATVNRQYAISENWSQISIISDRWKFAKWIDPSEKEANFDFRGKFPDMLFDRLTDPLEVNNLIGKNLPVERALRSALEQWEAQTSTYGRDAVLVNWQNRRKKK